MCLTTNKIVIIASRLKKTIRISSGDSGVGEGSGENVGSCEGVELESAEGVGEGVEVGVAVGVRVGIGVGVGVGLGGVCTVTTFMELLNVAVKPVLSIIWQYTVLTPSPLVNCQLTELVYGCHDDWFHVPSLLNLI